MPWKVKRRLITLSDNLQAWAPAVCEQFGNVSRRSARAYHAATADARGAKLPSWPNKGLRQSFASYHLAKHGDAARLMLDMGHVTPHMIFNHYRDIVTPKQTKRFLSDPSALSAQSVLSIATACQADG